MALAATPKWTKRMNIKGCRRLFHGRRRTCAYTFRMRPSYGRERNYSIKGEKWLTRNKKYRIHFDHANFQYCNSHRSVDHIDFGWHTGQQIAVSPAYCLQFVMGYFIDSNRIRPMLVVLAMEQWEERHQFKSIIAVVCTYQLQKKQANGTEGERQREKSTEWNIYRASTKTTRIHQNCDCLVEKLIHIFISPIFFSFSFVSAVCEGNENDWGIV